MLLLYNIFTQLYFFSIRVASLFNMKASKMIKGRKGWEDKLKSKVEKNKKYIWFHCASLGEFEQGRPLIEKLKTENPECKIILSFFSPSGYEIRENYEFADIVCYLPFDSKHNAKKFIEIINPEFAVFVKYEFWYYMIDRLNQLNIKFFLISGIFRKNQIFFKSYGKFYLNSLKQFTFLFLQDEGSKSILENFGITNILVCGDTRVDRVIQISEQKYENPLLEEFSVKKNIIVCGSTWPEDERILVEYINNADLYKFIIAPHEITSTHLFNLEKNINRESVRYSALNESNVKDADVVIIDCVGLLSRLYRYGKIAYIGGGFGKGIHNILEASVYNIPVLFGPNHKKFREALKLIDHQAAFCVCSYADFEFIVDKLTYDQILYSNSQMQSKKYFNNSSDATLHIYKKIKEIELI